MQYFLQTTYIVYCSFKKNNFHRKRVELSPKAPTKCSRKYSEELSSLDFYPSFKRVNSWSSSENKSSVEYLLCARFVAALRMVLFFKVYLEMSARQGISKLSFIFKVSSLSFSSSHQPG